MPTIDVLDAQKKKVGAVELKTEIFGAKPNGPLVHEAVVMQLASARQGTASTKQRGEVSGTGKKPWRQKHTGRARSGSVRSPLWRHGGTVFGPKPRQYGFAMPKKKYRAALRSALSAKLAAGALLVVSDLRLEKPKTRLLEKSLAQLGLKHGVLLVLDENRGDVETAARNLAAVTILRPAELTVYDVMRARAIVIPEREVALVQEAWS